MRSLQNRRLGPTQNLKWWGPSSHTVTLEWGQNKEFTHTHIRTNGHHNTSLLHSSQVSLTVAQGDDQSPLLPTEVGHDWGLALGPYLIEKFCLVSWSIPPISLVRAQPYGDSECQSKREPRKPPSGGTAHLSPSSSTPNQPSHQCSVLRGQCCWNLPGASRNIAEVRILKNQTPHLESWRTQVLFEKPNTTLGGLENSGFLSQWSQMS